MAGEGASSLILLSASIAVACMVSAAIFITAFGIRDSISQRSQVEENYLKSKILIINDVAYSPYDPINNTVRLYVKNIGYTVLDMNHTVVLLNASTYPLRCPDTIRALGDDVWAPQVVVEINITLRTPLQAGNDYIATVVADYGVKDSIKFRV